MRQPIEDRVVTISRAKTTMTFPANFMLIGAMTPVLVSILANRSAANWKFIEKVVGLVLSLQGDNYCRRVAPQVRIELQPDFWMGPDTYPGILPGSS